MRHVTMLVDRHACKDLPTENRQRSLFDDFDLDGIYRLGGGRRVKKAKATLDQMEAHVRLVLANAAAVEEHVGKQRQACGEKLRVPDPQERWSVRYVRRNEPDGPLPVAAATEDLADEGTHRDEKQSQRGGGRDTQDPADVLAEAVRTEVAQGIDPCSGLGTDTLSNWTNPKGKIALSRKGMNKRAS